MGVEPTSKAWEAFILPMNYTRVTLIKIQALLPLNKSCVSGIIKKNQAKCNRQFSNQYNNYGG